MPVSTDVSENAIIDEALQQPLRRRNPDRAQYRAGDYGAHTDRTGTQLQLCGGATVARRPARRSAVLPGRGRPRPPSRTWHNITPAALTAFIAARCGAGAAVTRVTRASTSIKLGQALLPERDLQFSYLGLQTLYDRYFIHADDTRFELPQIFFMRVAMGAVYSMKTIGMREPLSSTNCCRLLTT